MDIIKQSINKPVLILVAVIFVVLFGLIGFFSMPYQLSPSVVEPEITVSTIWSGATPYEIEREIIEEQERVLKGIPGLKDLESSSFNSRGEITLRFRVDVNVNDALLRVSNRLDEVRQYPDNADKPIINATGAATSPVIWIAFKTIDNNPNPISSYRTYFEDELRQYIERVVGVADLFVSGGSEKEMQIIVLPEKLAAYSMTINELISVLRQENINISAGKMDMGRRDYRIRTVAEYNRAEDIGGIVIKSSGGRRVTIKDVATVQPGYAKIEDSMMHNFTDGIAIGVKPEPGTNILELTDRVEEVVNWLNEGKLKQRKLFFDWAYDQRRYINGAIALVKNNVIFGGSLAIIVLLLFLRNFSSTLVIATSIPISIIGTFIFMNLMGRNLNVISLAGISFAVGMLVDNAIVVLENIDRHRKAGKSPFDAAYEGTKEVYGAIISSTLTTVAVFLPVIFIKEEAGQLFRDIAIAVTFAVTLSLFVSLLVIPMLSKNIFTLIKGIQGEKSAKKRDHLSFLVNFGNAISTAVMGLVGMATRNRLTAFVTVAALTALSLISVKLLFPKMEYLPQGNRNLVISILIPPPGLSYEERDSIGKNIFEYSKPYFETDYEELPGIKTMFYVGSESIMLFGAISNYEDRASELLPLFQGIINKIPGMFGISTQAGIFQNNIGRGRTIDVDISGDDLNTIIGAAGALFGSIMQEIPHSQVRPIPSLEMLYPEIRVIPRRERLRELQMDAEDLGVIVDVYMDGRRIGDFKKESEKKIDLILKGPDKDVSTPEQLFSLQVVTPSGKSIPLSSLALLERSSGITQIRHLERKRTVTLQVTPPFSVPLQSAMEKINDHIFPALSKAGILKDVEVRMSGTADKLTETRKALQGNFLLAVAITYLLMSALFGNFIYPLVIMFTVPLAASGGFIGIKLVNLFITPQPLDILTMLGFVILIGIVVNNAILIVHQTLTNIRDHHMEHREAILKSTQIRLRPIYMSAFTSIFGMLPLVVAPGPGSELYRGLGSVVLGGLAMSTLFTVFVIPALLMFFVRFEKTN